MNRTQKAMKLIGWQGGTVHQVNDELSRVLSTLETLPERLKRVHILNLSEHDYELALFLYSRNVLDLDSASC